MGGAGFSLIDLRKVGDRFRSSFSVMAWPRGRDGGVPTGPGISSSSSSSSTSTGVGATFVGAAAGILLRKKEAACSLATHRRAISAISPTRSSRAVAAVGSFKRVYSSATSDITSDLSWSTAASINLRLCLAFILLLLVDKVFNIL